MWIKVEQYGQKKSTLFNFIPSCSILFVKKKNHLKMKYIVILGDGMADEPIAGLGGKTPLQAAAKPHIDRLAAMGCSGLLETVPQSMHPGSEVANMAVLGYNVRAVYEGRGVLEAASMGIDLQEGDLALRCNLVTLDGDCIKNHSAGHISSEEAAQLMDFLNKTMGNENIRFFPGVSYRNLLILKNGNKHIRAVPPHDIMGAGFRENLVQPENEDAKKTAGLLNYLIVRSRWLLLNHPVNLKRISEGKEPATCIWPWSPGHKPEMPSFAALWNIEKSAVISAVDLIQGIGHLAGMNVLKVEGATGLYDTNYEGKAQAAVDALEDHDFVYLHIEAPDEAGHEGDFHLKVKTIEDIDARVVKTIIEQTAKMEEPVAIAVLPDHPTPCAARTHTRTPVPFVIFKPGQAADNVAVYDEFSAQTGQYGLLEGDEFMRNFLSENS